jgi:hypothetical protein
MKTTDYTGFFGHPWRVRLIVAGDRYGLEDRVLHKGRPMIEWFSRAHSDEGIFVSRYFISTLDGSDGYSDARVDGLCLGDFGRDHNMQASGDEIRTVLNWAARQMEVAA